MNISITLAARIREAAHLPQVGSLDDIYAYNRLRDKLVGFGEQQMINWRIVPVHNSFVTALPNTNTTVTLEDDLVVEYAKLIRKRSGEMQITSEEADLYKLICDEADRITEDASNENRDGE